MTKKRISVTWIRAISYLCVACVALGVCTAVNVKRARQYRDSLELTRQRVFSQLCENLDDISTSLEKCRYSSTSYSVAQLSDDISASAAAAKLSLAALDCGDAQTGDIYKFLSQVGAYTRAISKKEYNYRDNSENLTMLSDYAKNLNNGVSALCSGYYDGTVSFEQAVSTLDLYSKSGDNTLFSDGFSDTEQALTDYPTLIYDGPFSDTEEQTSALNIKSLREITKNEARKLSADIMGVQDRQLNDDGDETGTLELYCFSAGDKSTGITKNGGKLCYMLYSGYCSEITISPDEAIERAKEYLDGIGYKSMAESYYSVYDGVCTVNFAYSQQGVIMYPDLIKVGVALDTGNICTLDARGYLMNHTDRKIKTPALSAEDAASHLNTSLRHSKQALTLIPKNGSELLCYEFLCKDTRDNDALVYINAQTGKEEEILLLLYSDSGTLTK